MLKKTSIFGLIFLLSLSACKKKETSWTSDWVAPLVNDTLTLKSLENDSTLVVNSSFNYELNLTRTIIDKGLSDFLEIPDTSIIQDYVLAVGSISIPPGASIVNQIEEHTLNVPDVQLKKIRVSKGVINVKVFNPLPTTAFFTVKLPGVEKDGVGFSENYSAPPAVGNVDGIVTANLDISGYWLDLTGELGDGYNILQSQLIVNSSPTGPTVNLTNQDVIKVQADFKDLRIDYARGYFGNQVFTESINRNLEQLNSVESGSIDLPGTTLRFEVENGLKIGAKITINSASNTNYSGNTVSLNSPQIGNPIYLDQASGSWSTLNPSIETIEFTPSNSNLEQYLENLGKDHLINYKLELNPWGNVSGGWNEIFPNSRLKIKLHAELPLTVGMDGLTLRDTFNIDLAQNTDKTHIESGDIVLNATNAFPFKGEMTLFFLDEAGNLLHSVQGTTFLQSSLYGDVDPSDGLRKKKSEVHFVLTNAIIKDLERITQVCVRAKLDTPDPVTSTNQTVSIPAGAFMSVKLKAMFRLKTVL